jgi:hypothetical protein
MVQSPQKCITTFWPTQTMSKSMLKFINSGNFNVREATYEIELYGWEGEFLGSYRESARLNLFPGESVFLSHDLWEYDVFEVYVRIIEVW